MGQVVEHGPHRGGTDFRQAAQPLRRLSADRLEVDMVVAVQVEPGKSVQQRDQQSDGSRDAG